MSLATYYLASLTSYLANSLSNRVVIQLSANIRHGASTVVMQLRANIRGTLDSCIIVNQLGVNITYVGFLGNPSIKGEQKVHGPPLLSFN